MVAFVRKHSNDERLNRPFRETNIFRRRRYKKTCQRRFDAQRKFMGKKTVVEESSPESESGEDLFDDANWGDASGDEDPDKKVWQLDRLCKLAFRHRLFSSLHIPDPYANHNTIGRQERYHCHG